MPVLYRRLVTTSHDIECVRLIRNLTSGGFSHFNGQISHSEQVVWWASMQGRLKAWLYLGRLDGSVLRVVGYGLLREEDGLWWNSVAVRPLFQGQKLGSYITHDLIGKYVRPIYSAVRRDNPAALGMHHQDEWEEISGPEPDRLIYLRSKV